MQGEMDCLCETDTWELVYVPEGEKVLDVKWVYTVKTGGLRKARLVVKGFQQEGSVEEVYAPVARLSTLKMFLVTAGERGTEIEQMDVQSAFLNSKIVSEVYVKHPKGFEQGCARVFRLKRSLYGLKESPRNWYNCFNEFVVGLGFERSKHDFCLYSRKQDIIYVIIFVDDLLISGDDINVISEIKQSFSKRFNMKDLGRVKTYLGMEIKYDLDKKILGLSRSKYIDKLAERFNVNEANPYKTLMEQNLKLLPSSNNEGKDCKF